MSNGTIHIAAQQPTTHHESNQQLREAVADMMFANGDSMDPNDQSIDLMLQLLHEQLTFLLENARQWSQGENKITLSYVLYNFRSHPQIIARFMKYAADRTMLANVSSSLSSDDAKTLGFNVHQSNKHEIERFANAFCEFDTSGQLRQIIDRATHSEFVDLLKQKRLQRLLRLSNGMNSEIYAKYSHARRRCLCYKSDRHVLPAFKKWIGHLNLDAAIILALNFVASEIVAQMVEHASLAREDEVRNSIVGSTSTPFYESPLDLRHYRAALRSNIGYQQNRNLLFGYVPNSTIMQNSK
ncbi:Transcription initiation protein SPT3-like protein isoform X1 [Aphelenchoides besseyi]|nr:Transcription initiation protein SPT3-like protein isoform X1 [Aphelenchoides besseyi]KAI6209280.1 Transcription initiation protein SPT3-like protein isoform X1 [Aphelenchoides besseyi]